MAGDYREFKDVQHHPDEVTLVTTGEGTTSQGEFWESLNTASMAKLPVLYVVEDNGYAISVPVQYQTPGGNISRLLANFPNFHIEECDGTDLLASYAAMRRAVEYIRSGHGPALVHGHVHPSLLALALRRREALPARERTQGRTPSAIPLPRFQKFLIAEGILDDALQTLHARWSARRDAEVQAACRAASYARIAACRSPIQLSLVHVYSGGV